MCTMYNDLEFLRPDSLLKWMISDDIMCGKEWIP